MLSAETSNITPVVVSWAVAAARQAKPEATKRRADILLMMLGLSSVEYWRCRHKCGFYDGGADEVRKSGRCEKWLLSSITAVLRYLFSDACFLMNKMFLARLKWTGDTFVIKMFLYVCLLNKNLCTFVCWPFTQQQSLRQ